MITVTLRCDRCEYDLMVSELDFLLPKEGDANQWAAITTWFYVCPKCKQIFEENLLTGGKEEYHCKKCGTKMLEIDIEPPPYAGEDYAGEYTATCPICKKEMRVKVISIDDI